MPLSIALFDDHLNALSAYESLEENTQPNEEIQVINLGNNAVSLRLINGSIEEVFVFDSQSPKSSICISSGEVQFD